VNLLLFSPLDLADEGQLIIRDQRLEHLRNVLRASPGDSVRVGELGGLKGRAEIREMDSKQARLAFHLDTPPPAKLPLEIILALPRPKMLRRILRTVAECGVPRLHLINSYRVEKSFWHTPALAEAAVRGYLIQGLEQAQDTVLPEVHCHRGFKPFVEDALPAMLEGKRALLAHPGAEPPCPRDLDRATVLLIGPEGGFIPYEIERLEAAGCEPVTLGPRILRVETALTALLGRLA
jgi:RsmE family RNA methyltransferase